MPRNKVRVAGNNDIVVLPDNFREVLVTGDGNRVGLEDDGYGRSLIVDGADNTHLLLPGHYGEIAFIEADGRNLAKIGYVGRLDVNDSTTHSVQAEFVGTFDVDCSRIGFARIGELLGEAVIEDSSGRVKIGDARGTDITVSDSTLWLNLTKFNNGVLEAKGSSLIKSVLKKANGAEINLRDTDGAMKIKDGDDVLFEGECVTMDLVIGNADSRYSFKDSAITAKYIGDGGNKTLVDGSRVDLVVDAKGDGDQFLFLNRSNGTIVADDGKQQWFGFGETSEGTFRKEWDESKFGDEDIVLIKNQEGVFRLTDTDGNGVLTVEDEFILDSPAYVEREDPYKKAPAGADDFLF